MSPPAVHTSANCLRATQTRTQLRSEGEQSGRVGRRTAGDPRWAGCLTVSASARKTALLSSVTVPAV